MAKLYVDTIEPEGATTNLAIGEAGQDVILPGNDIRANVLQDAGGNAILTSDGSGTLSGLNSGLGSPKVLLNETVASNVVTVQWLDLSYFTSTYKHYMIEIINFRPVVDNVSINFAGTTDSNGSVANWNQGATTSTYYQASHSTNDTTAELAYESTLDKLNVSGDQLINYEIGNATEYASCGEIHLFNPASSTYYKTWYATTQSYMKSRSWQTFVSAWWATTDPINGVRFATSGGNFYGTFRLYGMK